MVVCCGFLVFGVVGSCVDFVLNCFELDVLYSGCLRNVVFGLLLWFIAC